MYKRDLELARQWSRLTAFLGQKVGKRPKDLNSVLFLVGVHELGKGNLTFSKEEKQDLMHIAICKVLSLAGYYELVGVDADGWPHWKPTRKLPHIDLLEQEQLLRQHLIEYFVMEFGWNPEAPIDPDGIRNDSDESGQ